jgi:hypothetical protein
MRPTTWSRRAGLNRRPPDPRLATTHDYPHIAIVHDVDEVNGLTKSWLFPPSKRNPCDRDVAWEPYGCLGWSQTAATPKVRSPGLRSLAR